jgi:hypothetical protein
MAVSGVAGEDVVMNATLRNPDRRNLLPLVTLAVTLLSTPTQAALISHEEFAYPPETPVLGRNGGTGWQAAWGTGGTVVAPGLVWPGLVTAGNALQALTPSAPAAASEPRAPSCGSRS